MTGEVIDLAARRPNPHASGEAFCLDCKHTWAAVAPTGTIWLECPSCGLVRGRFKYQHESDTRPHWHCYCGNDLFFITADGCYCPNCGTWANGF